MVNFNTGIFLRDCCQALSAMSDTAGLEIIVVDNASTDTSISAAQQAMPGIRLISNSLNRGFAQAANQGMAIARGGYIVLLNPDAIIREDALLSMARFMDRHPEAGMSGCTLLNPDGTLQYSAHPFPRFSDIFFDRTHLSLLFPHNRLFGRYQMSYWAHDACREVDWVSGACCMVRRKAVDEVGLLDERFFMYGEDIDWCRRFKRAKWKVFYVPEAVVIHTKGVSSPEQGGKASLQSWVSLVIFWEKYHGFVPARLLAVFIGCDAWVKWIFCAVLFFLSGNRNFTIKKEREYCRQLLSLLSYCPRGTKEAV
jgi:GT2 family glycosyltransferase